jgi:two-component system sensor histidine kinase HydH
MPAIARRRSEQAILRLDVGNDVPLGTEALSSLVAAIVGLAIGASVLLREPRRSTHVLFATFAFNIALVKLFSFFATYLNTDFFLWATMLAAVSLPATAQRFFQAFLGDEAGPPPLSRSTVVGAVVFYLALCASHFIGQQQPLHARTWFGVAFAIYVFAGLYSSVYYLYRRYRATPSRVEKIRLLYLVVGGVATVTFALVDLMLSAWGPSFANIFITIYLFFLSQTLVRYRLLDLNELLGRMMVLATLVLIVTLVYGALVKWVRPTDHELFFFNTLMASTAILILFDPLRTRVEGALTRWLFQEKYELTRRVANLRADLMNVIDVRDLTPRVLSALEDSRRVTHASIYIVDPDGSGYELAGHIGPRPEARIDAVAQRAFLERLRRSGVISVEGLDREVAALKLAQSEEKENLALMSRVLEMMHGSVVLAIAGEDQLLGMLVLRDERLREAYSSDEIELFRGVAASIGVTLQNSRVYELMKERERLASLGQMAAGLAHEIRNPLGSIKGAAQVLQPIVQETNDASIKEFLNIIVEEVDRLNKIVSQFLDYARPYRGDPKPLDINDAVRKTLALMEKEGGHTGIEISTALFEGLPQVRADAEQLRQVFLNLSINAIQAMPQGGKLAVSSSLRRSTLRGATAAFLEVRFRDTGVGITAGDLKNLFIPFFTTKDKGTGLGLPISQRIVENHGGRIEVRSKPGAGSTFTVLLPIEADVYASYAGTQKRPPPIPMDSRIEPLPTPAERVTGTGGAGKRTLPPSSLAVGADKKTMELDTPQPAMEGGESEPIRVVPPTGSS